METATQDVNTAVESSTSASETAVIEVPRSPKEYANWRNTGKLPEPKKAPSKPEESATTETSATGDKSAEKDAPAPEAGEPKQERRSGPKLSAQDRLTEVLNDLRNAGLSPAELKTFKREAARAAEQPKAAPEKTENPAEPKKDPELKKPKLEDFNTYEDFDTARDEYNEKLATKKAREAVDEYRREQAQENLRKQGEEKLARAVERYGEEAKPTIMGAVQAIGEAKLHPALMDMVESSPVIADLMYVMGSKPEDLNAFLDEAKSNPAAAIRRLVLTEQLVQQELAKGAKAPEASTESPERDDSGKFVSTKPPAKKVTEAPPPSREVSGRSAPPGDEVEAAFKAGDMARFREAANRRDLAKRKGI